MGAVSYRIGERQWRSSGQPTYSNKCVYFVFMSFVLHYVLCIAYFSFFSKLEAHQIRGRAATS